MPTGQAVRLLIVDDQPQTREALRSLLTLSDRVDVIGEAADGKEAVALVAECRPDVVLMDIQMPTMDGLEATRHIKSRWPDIRIIALTMYARYRSQALAAGADVFMLKGTPTEMLYRAILGGA